MSLLCSCAGRQRTSSPGPVQSATPGCSRTRSGDPKAVSRPSARGSEDGGRASARGSEDGDRASARGSEDGDRASARGSVDGGRVSARGSEDGGRASARGSEDGGRASARGSEDGDRASARGSVDGGRASARGSVDGGRASARGSDDGGRLSVRGSEDGGRVSARGSEDGSRALATGSDDGGRLSVRGSEDGGRVSARGSEDGSRALATGSDDGGRLSVRGSEDGGRVSARGSEDGSRALATGSENGDRPSARGFEEGGRPSARGSASARLSGTALCADPQETLARSHREEPCPMADNCESGSGSGSVSVCVHSAQRAAVSSAEQARSEDMASTSPSQDVQLICRHIDEYFAAQHSRPYRRALDLAQNSNVQDAFVIAVEQQARERLERLSALKRIKPVDMTKLSQQLNQQIPATEQQQELNGFIESSPIYVTSIPPTSGSSTLKTAESASAGPQQQSVRRVPPVSRGGAGVAVKVSAGGTEDPDSAELELKQELEVCEGEPQTEPAGDALPPSPPSSASPFANGRTEVLIGQDDPAARLRTTAIVEADKLTVSDDGNSRPRRRSGGSIVVVDTGQDTHVDNAVDIMMMTLDNGPHREMAVDVPDSFIASTKTPPRYPPPRPRVPQTPTVPAVGATPAAPGVNGSASKPVPPPRDHLRIERDGRLVNRAPAPQVPARTAVNNNTISADREPTKEQLDSIRKFQEALRKRKEDEERVAQQTEFLHSSVRGSRKLQALESHPPRTGLVNDGYSSAEEGEGPPSGPGSGPAAEGLRRTVSYGELVASLQRLQLHLKKSSLGQGGYSSLEGQLAAVKTLLASPQFGRALAVHHKVQEVWRGRVPAPASAHAQALVRDCLDALQPCSLPGAAELALLLTGHELEGLVQAHDAIAAVAVPVGAISGDGSGDDNPEHLPGSNNIKIIKIEKTNEPLGATVRNEGEAVIIGRIVRGGAAEKSGLLREGDEVLEVNGVEMRGKSVNEVCDLLSAMTGTLTFLVVPDRAARPPPPPANETLMHMKAHFDYDPEDDLYIPCRELGISFQKGDVLHVISQDDPNWWQAYREGEEDQTLAGLIPSRAFQHQRESMKQTIAGDKLTKEKSRKAGTLLCAKKNPKKKKKKLPYTYNDGGYPLYTTSTVDDYEAEEILTYEEVSLYYPRANHKRPIVLIGPPNIGRHELRQRLMEDADRFAAAIPHTSRPRKDGEVDGQDYHFISRAQFESDILGRRFVEHGEYERAYYGTSLDAIRAVVSAARICVLNLHPQSLRILRTSDLKPYVVFVAPPSLEKLRQKKIRAGEAYKEDELKDIIEKAREMEDKYGHYFDMIIINNDTERAYHQLLNEINSLEREPQWVPASWVKSGT